MVEGGMPIQQSFLSAACLKYVLREGRCKATWKRDFKLPWREAGPPDHHDDKWIWTSRLSIKDSLPKGLCDTPSCQRAWPSQVTIQGYLAHQKMHPPRTPP